MYVSSFPTSICSFLFVIFFEKIASVPSLHDKHNAVNNVILSAKGYISFISPKFFQSESPFNPTTIKCLFKISVE